MYFDPDIQEPASTVELAIAKKFNESEENRRSLRALVKVMFDDDIDRAGKVSGRKENEILYTREDVSRYFLKKLSKMLDEDIVKDKCFFIEDQRMREKVREDAVKRMMEGGDDVDEKNKMPVL